MAEIRSPLPSDYKGYKYRYIGNSFHFATVATLMVSRFCDSCTTEYNLYNFSLDPHQERCSRCFTDDIVDTLRAFDEDNKDKNLDLKPSLFKVLDHCVSFKCLLARRRFVICTDIPIHSVMKFNFGLEPFDTVRGLLTFGDECES
jgi:hypothetical protein